MKIDLAVIGQGAATPAGIGIDALLRRQPTATSIAPLGQAGEIWPVLRVDQKDAAFARWQREPRLRRASPITFFLVEVAEQALAGVAATDRAETGLIVAYSAGCLAYSRRFFEGIAKQGQKTASPALFPETVFNSPVSHVATVLGLNGASYALVGDESAWIAALQTASVWLKIGRVKHVLVLGAEEFDPLILDAYRSARWLRKQNFANGFRTSEGAAGVLVRKTSVDDSLFISTARDGLIYRTRKEAATAGENLLRETERAIPIFRTARHNWLATLEEKALASRLCIETTQSYLGEAFTASAAWNTVRALSCLGPETARIIMPIWGQNHQLGCLELENRK